MKKIPTAKKAVTHPKIYSIFAPNELVRAKKLNLNLMELRVYNEVLNNNHLKEPDKLTYVVFYKHVFDVTDVRNKMKNVRRISGNLQRRVFYFNQQFMMEYFGEDADVSMVPFPKISFREDHFEVELYKDFKKILTLVKGDFTKGDIETLRTFNSTTTNSLYWLLCNKQAFKGTWEVDLEELKDLLGLYGKYEVWSNFKTKVLDLGQEELVGTWQEFEYSAIRKGMGGPVKSILFKFKHGSNQERDSPAGEVYSWEEKLITLLVDHAKVKELRHRVRAGSMDLDKGIQWDTEYVKFSIEAAMIQMRETKKDKNKKQIGNPGGWIYSGLMDGRWNEYVNARREKIKSEVQATLDFAEISTVSKLLAPATKKALLTTVSGQTKLTKDELMEWESLYKEIATNEKFTQTFEEFLGVHHITKEGNAWVKNQ